MADRQFGNLTRSQLLDAGLSTEAIDHWLRRGRLHLRHRGVYALGHLSLPQFSPEMAAVLACQPRALLSHDSAAYLWGFRAQPPGKPHVTVVGRDVRQQSISVHRVGSLARADARRRHGIPLTSPARAILDMAPGLTDRELELAVHEAIALNLLTMNQLRAALKRYPRRRGSARLNALTAQEAPKSLTRSPAEEDLLRLIRRTGLPAPHLNAKIGPWSPDFYWPGHKLAVEVDGIDFHSSRVHIERDHRKDIDLRTRGIDVMRFVPRQVKREPELVLVTIARELARREP